MKVVVREARGSDRKPLMKFVATTWGGHDYIPSVWDEWLHDRSGKMFVVEVDGEQVGMNRLRFLEDGTGWLEGVRIRPDFRGRGLASLLGKKSMEYASKFGVRTFRLTSTARNRAALRQVEKMGFKEVGRFDVLLLPKRRKKRDQKGVRRLALEELDEVMGFVRASDEYRLGRGVYWESYVVQALNRDAVKRLIEEGFAFSAEDRKGGRAVAIGRLVREGREVWRQISFLCGRPSLCRKLVSHLFQTSRVETRENYVFLPRGTKLSRTLKEMGLKRDFQMVLFEGHVS